MDDFISLPLDIKTLIFGHIRRRSDLKTLYLTCKDFYHIVIPRVYYRITLYEDTPFSTLCDLLNAENRGIQHLRHLHIEKSQVTRETDELKQDTVLYMLAHQLPRNIVRSFTIDTTRQISSQIMETLHKRQRRLLTLRFDSRLWPIRWNEARQINIESISTIQMLIDSHRILRYARKCIVSAPALQCLEVYLNMGEYCTGKEVSSSEELHRAAASGNVIIRLLGKRLPKASSDGNACEEEEGILDHRRLSTLRLHGMNLSGVARILTKAVDVPYLTSLSLHSCEHENSLLRALSGGDIKCERLRHVAIVQSPDVQPEQGDDHPINDFLESFDTLESLVISAPNTEALTPSVSAVVNHGELGSLYLDCKNSYDQSTEFYEWEVVNELRRSKKLKQLALNLPSTVLNPNGYSGSERLPSFLDTLSIFPALRTLHVLNLPKADDSEVIPTADDAGNVYLGTCLAAYAKYIFAEVPDVTSLALGRQWPSIAMVGEIQPRTNFYVRAKLVDPDGETTLVPMGKSKAAIREMEQSSEILDL